MIQPDWNPTPDDIERANVTAFARELGLPDYPALHRWSVEHRGEFWLRTIDRLGIRFQKRPTSAMEWTGGPSPTWLPGAELNIVESCFNAPPESVAVIQSDGIGRIERYTYGQLQTRVAQVASALAKAGLKPGDAVGVILPMTYDAVAIYLGVIAAGCAFISIADSFAADEIAMRLRVGQAKLVLTQDCIPRGEKKLPLYDRIKQVWSDRAIVLVWDSSTLLRSGDLAFTEFLKEEKLWPPITQPAQSTINILFSSGTTGEPKAIPWSHLTPLKCAADAHFHHDINPNDVLCWPTSLGWMMGPWLIFASLLNRATIALFTQSPTIRAFGEFVQNTKVTMLGLVPSLVRSWRDSKCMEGLDWANLKCFSSSGECSNPDDMRYLMSLAGNRPIIEYCGGTEIGGGYIASTIVQPNIASTFSTPTLGLDLVLLDESGQPSDRGEVFIDGPSIGLSTRLLNREHDPIYFDGTPMGSNNIPLRRHGDELERLENGYFKVAGRSDDTMNLGGIKVGCAEIERVLNTLPGVKETAAVAIAPPGGGPSRLCVFLVATQAESEAHWKSQFQQAIRTKLNPLFHLDSVRVVDAMPRTMSNKIIRRELRRMCES